MPRDRADARIVAAAGPVMVTSTHPGVHPIALQEALRLAGFNPARVVTLDTRTCMVVNQAGMLPPEPAPPPPPLPARKPRKALPAAKTPTRRKRRT